MQAKVLEICFPHYLKNTLTEQDVSLSNVSPLKWSYSIMLLPPESPLLILLFFIFLLLTASVIIHLPVYTFLFLMSWLSSFVVHFSFTPFSLSAILFSLLVCVCLFVCVDGIGLGSSPTSSQNEALPPSTDWPVSAYTSSFSLSSPETDDAGTRFIHNVLHPTLQWLTRCNTTLFCPSCYC